MTCDLSYGSRSPIARVQQTKTRCCPRSTSPTSGEPFAEHTSASEPPDWTDKRTHPCPTGRTSTQNTLYNLQQPGPNFAGTDYPLTHSHFRPRSAPRFHQTMSP